jgi:hypothetical protein
MPVLGPSTAVCISERKQQDADMQPVAVALELMSS